MKSPRPTAAATATIIAWTALVLASPRTDVQRYVTVVDSDGRPVLGLSHEDFALKDGGVRRPIVSVEPATAPISVDVVFSNIDGLSGDVAKALSALADTAASTPDSPALDVRFFNGGSVAGGSDWVSVKAGHAVNAAEFPHDTKASALPQNIVDAARSFVGREADRRIVLAVLRRSGEEVPIVAQGAPAAGPTPEQLTTDVVDALTDAKTALWTLELPYSATPPVAKGPIGFDSLLSATTDASGSIRTKVKTTADLASAARDLFYIWRGQYLVTYTWPDPMLSFFKLEVRHDRGVVLTTGWDR